MTEHSMLDSLPVLVDIDGARAGWSDVQGFLGDPDVVAAARTAVAIGLCVDVGEDVVASEGDNPRGALAALHAFNPGRCRTLALPLEIEL